VSPKLCIASSLLKRFLQCLFNRLPKLSARRASPKGDEPGFDEIVLLKKLAQEIIALQNDEDASPEIAADRLRHLMQLGGSPQGARPKMLVDVDPSTGTLSNAMHLTANARPWLVKLPAQGEHREVCALEELYARVACQAGLGMPPSQFFDLGPKSCAFGVERFDRVRQLVGQETLKVLLLSLSGYLQADFRLPSLD
jgi:serine/threonine-protein kinase HipA